MPKKVVMSLSEVSFNYSYIYVFTSFFSSLNKKKEKNRKENLGKRIEK